VIPKKAAGFWPRITKAKGKFHNIKIDWSLWVDEDEIDEAERM
jgi:hypothetical protein